MAYDLRIYAAASSGLSAWEQILQSLLANNNAQDSGVA